MNEGIEASFTSIAETALHPVVVYDREARIVFANHAAATALGAPAASLRGRSFGELHPDRLAWALENFERALESDRPVVHEQTFERDGNELTYLSVVQVIRTEDDEPLFVINSYDVTPLRASEHQTTLQARLLDSVQQAVMATDVEGRLIFWNRYAEQLYGWRSDEVLGRDVRELTVTPSLAGYAEAIMTRIARGEGWSGEYEVRRKDGSTFPAAVTLAPITGADGDPMGVVGVSSDLTERKRMERDLVRANNLESLSLLAGGIAHDFNNLMTGVIGNLSLLESLLERDDSEAGEVAREARRAADRTRGLANQLLTFARGGAPVRAPTDVGQLLSDVAQVAVHGSSCRLELTIEPELPPLAVDPVQIGQVFQNLTRNAVESMAGRGGCLRVDARRVEPGGGTLWGRVCLRVVVEDEGVGIAPEALDRVFDPYFTTKQTGHGLGLAITHSIVARHEGHISVESTPNAGARFTVLLPAIEASPVEDASTHLPRPTVRTGRVLVMDDDPSVHQTLRRLLAHFGYETTSVTDGDRALEAHAQALRAGRPYDLILTDLTVSNGRGGRQIIDELLQIDPSAHVVITSGYAWDPVLSRFAEYGFADRIRKPVGLDDLRELLERFEQRRTPSS